ncbi:hypothetical protein M670_01617 [Schinkia azotoformans MEV2011]|uniref:Uncharacterized protein n=2 Tax=Schinkia azotoformans TaxID=1454 RepID=K6C099_SCHAZ|nr:hypothetical protein BAZO_13179 [Schinkia azotoformans LMG 9581]KEF39226.1 hypothetical protein M670_01617 [Schinkia azotoformans MEV2011]
MALTDIPTLQPSKGSIFLIALPLVIFIFFFVKSKKEDAI